MHFLDAIKNALFLLICRSMLLVNNILTYAVGNIVPGTIVIYNNKKRSTVCISAHYFDVHWYLKVLKYHHIINLSVVLTLIFTAANTEEQSLPKVSRFCPIKSNMHITSLLVSACLPSIIKSKWKQVQIKTFCHHNYCEGN